MIQSQYDAALSNPPWERDQDTFDIDDRPKKRRKTWYYEVVAPDGQVVDVIDDEVAPLDSQDVEPELPRPSTGSTNTPLDRSDMSSELSSCPSSPASTPEPGSDSQDEEDADSKEDSGAAPLRRTLHQEESSTSTGSNITQSSQNSRSLPNIKGRDLFDAMIWGNAFTTSVFYMFISSLRQRVLEVKEVTETHKFLQVLRDSKRLVRNYTQNIDMLEQLAGLSSDITSKKLCETVPLHGTLDQLRCNLCAKLSEWKERETATLAGTAPDCPFCVEANAKRTSNGRRGLAVGRLRPDIVLYGEEHPHANLVGAIVTNDLSLALDVLIIMGTSLKVHGLKIMLKEFAKAVHARGGKVIFVNRTKPPESIWGDIIDEWIEFDCDKWVLDLKERRPDIWGLPFAPKTVKIPARTTYPVLEIPLEPTPIRTYPVVEIPYTKRRPQCIRDDKINGVFITFKILDALRKLKDQNGRISERTQYWPYLDRYSTGPLIEAAPIPVPVPVPIPTPVSKKKPPAKRKTTKPPSKATVQLPHTTIDLPKRPHKYVDPAKRFNPSGFNHAEKDHAIMVSDMWNKLRDQAPGISAMPPELQQPFRELPGRLPSYLTPFAFGTSNQFPNYGGDQWHKEKLTGMDLVHLPPTGLTIPMHTPKNTKPVVVRAINHGYGTRASARSSLMQPPEHSDPSTASSPPSMPKMGYFSTPKKAEDSSLPKLGYFPIPKKKLEDTGIVDDATKTNEGRIKRLSSIGNLMSSPETSSEEIWHDAAEVLTEA